MTPEGDISGDQPETICVDLGPRAYDVVVGPGLIEKLPAHLSALGARAVTAVVCDETVAGLHLPAVTAALDGAGIIHTGIVVADGEASKSFQALESVVDRLLEARIERGDVIVAVGGGVVGDLAGFAASILRRGTGVAHVPTTLLAQVDSAIGGKTAINTRHGKNLVGAFYQPRLVLADTGVLNTLSPRALRAGYAEIVKYGLIGDAAFFAWLEDNGAAVLAGDAAARQHAIVVSCRAKARVVEADERESGERALLNLGHTFGHALETLAGSGGGLAHGEAVAIGMVMAFDLSVRLRLCPAGDATRVQQHLAAAGLPTAIGALGAGWDTGALIEIMSQDKKNIGGQLTFVLARRVGEAFVSRDVSVADVRAVLERHLAA
jgi:3-dehydroquinate synthase